ncbi:GTP pyrophosphokinase family protein [uncultured Eubacterium sp.]|uniref:GTP pyrophosphokinase n=1 Tax=uncultured Eubacterium sp. TaxID=165185 RepID=UPI00259A4A60|nr:hypothetical protein [uncultured Eubacterium sp.]
MKEEKKKKTNKKEEICKETDGDTVIKIATEINRKDKTEVDSVFEINTDEDAIDKTAIETEIDKDEKKVEDDTTQPGADLILLDDPKLRNEYLDCMKYLLTQITDFGFEQEQLIGRSIISHTKYRLKSRDSIVAKMIKKKRELTEENVFTYINDLAGIRVICLFLDDIYRVRDFIYQIPGISVVKEKDFVKKPKNSGYQSLHVIVQFTNGRKVEIQLRTIGMDFWSVLEYQLQYKKHHKKGKALKKELFSCAIDVRNMDQRMLDLRQSIENV